MYRLCSRDARAGKRFLGQRKFGIINVTGSTCMASLKPPWLAALFGLSIGSYHLSAFAMPRINRNQKEREQFLIREFIRHLGCRISKPTWPDRRDAVLTLTNARGKKRVAIEHTDFYNDPTLAAR